MRELILDWNDDWSAIDLVPLRGYRCYETHRWEQFDLPVWTNLSDTGSDASSIESQKICRVFAKHLPRFDRIVDQPWKARGDSAFDRKWKSDVESYLKSVAAFGFDRNFAVIISAKNGNALDAGSILERVSFYIRDEGVERRDLWALMVSKLVDMPLLVEFDRDVQAQCLVNDVSSLERIWDSLVEAERKRRE